MWLRPHPHRHHNGRLLAHSAHAVINCPILQCHFLLIIVSVFSFYVISKAITRAPLLVCCSLLVTSIC